MSVVYEELFERGVPVFASANRGAAERYARKIRLLEPTRRYVVNHEASREGGHRDRRA